MNYWLLYSSVKNVARVFLKQPRATSGLHIRKTRYSTKSS